MPLPVGVPGAVYPGVALAEQARQSVEPPRTAAEDRIAQRGVGQSVLSGADQPAVPERKQRMLKGDGSDGSGGGSICWRLASAGNALRLKPFCPYRRDISMQDKDFVVAHLGNLPGGQQGNFPLLLAFALGSLAVFTLRGGPP